MIERFTSHVASGNFLRNVEKKVEANRITMQSERKQSREAMRRERKIHITSLTPGKLKSIIGEESSSSNSVSSCTSRSDLVEDIDYLEKLTLKNKTKESSSSNVNPYVRTMTKK